MSDEYRKANGMHVVARQYLIGDHRGLQDWVRDQCGPGRLSCVWAGTDYDVRVSNRRDDTAPYHSTRVHVGDWVIVEVGTSGRTFLYVFSDSTFQRMYGPRPSVDAYDGVSNDKKEIT